MMTVRSYNTENITFNLEASANRSWSYVIRKLRLFGFINKRNCPDASNGIW